jgi:hypothetical protein
MSETEPAPIEGPPTGPTARGYWWRVWAVKGTGISYEASEQGRAAAAAAYPGWELSLESIWVDLTNVPPEWEVEIQRLNSQATFNERWAAGLPFWRRRLARATLAECAAMRAHIERIRAAKAVVP